MEEKLSMSLDQVIKNDKSSKAKSNPRKFSKFRNNKFNNSVSYFKKKNINNFQNQRNPKRRGMNFQVKLKKKKFFLYLWKIKKN